MLKPTSQRPVSFQNSDQKETERLVLFYHPLHVDILASVPAIMLAISASAIKSVHIGNNKFVNAAIQRFLPIFLLDLL